MTVAAPLGSVTLMFTDIEGSTKLLERLRDTYAVVLEQHRDLMRASFERWGGYEVDTQGDSFFVAFASASAAVTCAIEVQRALPSHDWPERVTVRVRIGIHTGEPILAPTGYIGVDVHRGARIGAAANGGQILVSAATQHALEASPMGDVEFVSIGVQRFKGLREPVSVFQVRAPGLLTDFPPIRTSGPADEAPSPGVSPYKGLLRFDEADADRFFGREETIGRVLAELAEWPFLAVVGASGSGKSSLVRAGVIPALKKASSRVVVMTPTADPFGALAAALTRGSRTPGAAQRLSDQLHADPDVLVARLRGRSRGGRVALVVDQFEELFTLCRDLDERAAFIAMLMGNRRSKADATAILLTLRADFYAQLAEYPELRAEVADHQLYIGPMEPADLRRAIEEPARLGGWEIAPGLVDLLLRDIGSEPGALPLLSHALLETWRRRRGHGMTLKGYFEAGEVRGAIARTADRVFERLAPEEQALAREMLLRLTELGEGTQDTRRRAGLHELLPAEGSAGAGEATRVLTTLVDARLVTVDEGAAEVAHEALIREWPMLREWLREDREGLRIQRQVTDAAAEWSTLGRDASLLYRGARLATTREWAASHDRALTEPERAFLEASVAAEQSEELARREQQERELDAARRVAEAERLRAEEQTEAARRLRRRAVVLAGAVVLAIGLGAAAALFASQASQQAAQAHAEANRATVRELANAADLSLPIDPERSILLALEAARLGGGESGDPLPEAQEALHRAVQASRVVAVMPGLGEEMVGGAMSPDGRIAVSLDVGGRLQAWKVETGELIATVEIDPPQPSQTTTLSFSPDGTRVAVPSSGDIKIFDVETWAEVASWQAHDQAITTVIFSPDGSQLASGGLDEFVRVWDAATHDLVTTIVVTADADEPGLAQVLSLAYMPDGKRIVAGLFDDRPDHVGSAQILDVATGELVMKLAEGPISSVAVSPDGSRIATGDWDTLTRVWDAASGDRLYTLYTHRSLVNGVAIDFTGTRLATASADGTARIVDLETGREQAVIAGHGTALFGVAFSRDGSRLLTTSGDATMRTWDVSASSGGEWAVLPVPDRVFRVAYSPDGSLMATGSTSGDVTVWDAETGEPLFQERVDGLMSGLIFSADSDTLFEGRTLFDGRAGSFIVRDARSGVVRSETEVPLAFGNMAISPDERMVAFLSTGLATIWDLESKTQIAEVGEFEGELTGVDFSPDGSLIAISAQSGDASVFAVPSGELQYKLMGHAGPVRAVRFSPDGTLLATGSNDGTARVWSAANGALLHTLTGHTGPVYSVDFNPDGSLLATGSIDATVKLWSSADFAANPLTLGGHHAGIYDVQFSPDGRRLISGSRDLTARVFAIDIHDLIEIAESKVTRPLNDAECQRYLHLSACPAPSG
ncbi:MAG: adenylate/guanylate cyclase domain-containing protein [Chloroflexota bacterium]